MEDLVLREMYNSKLEHVLTVKTLALAVLNPGSPDKAEVVLKDLIQVSMPWVSDSKPGAVPQTEAERLLQVYDTYKQLKLIK